MSVAKLRFKANDGSDYPDWEEKRLGDIGTVAMCKRVFKEQTSENGEVPFFKIGTFGDKPDAYITYKLFNELKTKYPYPKKGTVLLSASGTVGRQVIYNGEDAYYQDSNIVWLEHDDTIMDEFLKQFYSIVKWKGLEGSTIKRLYNKTILNTIFYLPSIPEQQKIADFLSTIDRVIEKQQATVEAWEQRKKGVMQKLFSQEVRFKADDGSDFPDWEERKLGEIIKFLNGRAYKQDELLNAGKYKVLRVGNLFTNDTYYYSNLELENDKYIEDGNLIYAWSATFGPRIYHGEKCIYHYHIWKLSFDDDKVLKIFLNQYLLYDVEKIKSQRTGGTMVHITKKAMENRELLFPSLPEQQKIADCLSALDDVIKKQKEILEKWQELKKGLLQQMFV